MLETDVLQAADLYKNAAQALDHQIARAIGYLPRCQRILRARSESSTLSEHSDSVSSLNSDSSATGAPEYGDSSVSEEDGWDDTESQEAVRQVA
jgi:hypothetical protein